jgi:hypothetical protein
MDKKTLLERLNEQNFEIFLTQFKEVIFELSKQFYPRIQSIRGMVEASTILAQPNKFFYFQKKN